MRLWRLISALLWPSALLKQGERDLSGTHAMECLSAAPDRPTGGFGRFRSRRGGKGLR